MSLFIRSILMCSIAAVPSLHAAEGGGDNQPTSEGSAVVTGVFVLDGADVPEGVVISEGDVTSHVVVNVNGEESTLSSAESKQMQKMVQEKLLPALEQRLAKKDGNETDFGEALTADLLPELRKMAEKKQAENYAALGKELGFSDDEFAAVKPLIERVESLRSQRAMVDREIARNRYASNNRSVLRQTFGDNTQTDSENREPSITHMQDAVKKLQALLKDRQGNDAEFEATLGQLRTARQTFDTVLQNARSELRTVLTREQEARLVVRGTLE